MGLLGFNSIAYEHNFSASSYFLFLYAINPLWVYSSAV